MRHFRVSFCYPRMSNHRFFLSPRFLQSILFGKRQVLSSSQYSAQLVCSCFLKAFHSNPVGDNPISSLIVEVRTNASMPITFSPLSSHMSFYSRCIKSLIESNYAKHMMVPSPSAFTAAPLAATTLPRHAERGVFRSLTHSTLSFLHFETGDDN
jgi:hypothetical protein